MDRKGKQGEKLQQAASTGRKYVLPFHPTSIFPSPDQIKNCFV